jgi:two-component system chemotaxis response regulator CheB
MEVREAKSGDILSRGCVLIAPGDKHMRLKRIGDLYKVECFEGDKVNGHCPSVDVLFESASKEAGGNAIGIILTGMGYDGARGLLSMRRKGASTIGQDERTSVVYGMPRAAYEAGAVQKQAALGDIPQLLYKMLSEH